MSTTTIIRPGQEPLWQLALASFLPARRRHSASRWIAHIPLTIVMLIQAMASMRLSNSAHTDEGLYLFTGHWIRSGEQVYSQPETFFSGAPPLYPVLASYIDSAGGLELVRAFSTLCMVSSTLAVYWTTSQLFSHRSGHRAGLLAASLFAFNAPVMFLGNFATFDAPSFTCIAWAAALAVWSSKNRRSVWWALPIGCLAALAVLLKYSSAIDLPFVFLLTLVGLNIRGQRAKILTRGILAGLVTVSIFGASIATWARDDFQGLISTTVSRHVPTPTPPLHLLENVFSWAGVTLVLTLAGAVYLIRRQPVLTLLLLAGASAAIAAQIRIGEGTSLHKHVVLGLIFGAPLAGLFLSEISKHFRIWGRLAVVATLWSSLILGLSQSATLFTSWPHTAGLASTLKYSIDAMPWIRTVGDAPEAMEYAFHDRTEHWQWTATWANSFTYEGLSGAAAYEQALKDNYFQLAFFDTSSSVQCVTCTEITGQLIPNMESYGFDETGKVVSPDGHVWTIWQRYDGIG